MRVFLDSSALIAASGSERGAATTVVHWAARHGWTLLSCPYCVAEVNHNIHKLRESAAEKWTRGVLPALDIVGDAWTSPSPLLLTAAKDKPVLISAMAAKARFLLTLDREDFGVVLNTSVYGVFVTTPGTFLEMQRTGGSAVGRIR